MPLSLLLLLLLSIMNCTADTVEADVPQIFDPPKDTVAFLDPEANITVTCNASGDFVHWIVNGTAFTNNGNSSLHSIHELVELGIRVCTLYIPAEAKYNETVVQCVAISEGIRSESQNATVLIQGLLAPASNLTVNSNTDSILISWIPPFSLNVTGVGVDIWYTLLICDVTDERNPAPIFRNDSQNLTRPQYTFTTANLSSSHKYNFTVVPINGAGQGQRSKPVTGTFEESDAGISNLSCVLIILLGIVAFVYIS